MSPLGGLPFLFAVATVILLSGYWLNALNVVTGYARRLALAALGGVTTLILFVAALNFFRPLSGIWLGVCLLPAAGALLIPGLRRALVDDLRSLVRSRTGLMVLGLAAVFLAWLFRVALADPSVLFYDGTTNHDSYIWITSGEYLQHHTYLEVPVDNPTQPWMNMAGDNVSWRPRRAQLGTETLLALFSGLIGTTPLHTCLYFAGALLLPWMAAVYLAITTFYRTQLSRFTIAALVLLQPVFVFFYANSNLPNLLGALMGAATVIATAQALRAETRRLRLGWCVLLVLGFHGQIAVYPEMLPFILLPCGLLWLRPWFARRWDIVRGNAVAVSAAFFAGALVNPVVTIRAWHGFQYSFSTARADVIFANLLEPLNAAEHVPGLTTLAIPAALQLGWVGGALLTLLILAGAAAGLARARDRAGALCTLAGSAALLIYTMATHFNYGWQKSAQFGAIFIVALTTAPLFEAQLENWRQHRRRWFSALCLTGVLGFYASATVVNFQQIRDWSRQKKISRDWQELHALSETTLCGQPVLIESASFRMPFFHSMWATYFLSSSRSYFAKRGGEGGGYMRLGVFDESAVPGGKPAAVLVGRRWAESFDANSPRLLEGREYILFREANRVTKLEGVYPTNGYPDHASTHFSIELTPHSTSSLRLTLEPYKKKNWPEVTWRIVHRTPAGAETVTTLSGLPPWQIDVALAAHITQTVECQVVSAIDSPEPLPFAVRQLTIVSPPMSSAPLLFDASHTSHTSAQTGIQRVVRALFAELDARHEVAPICYDPHLEGWRALDAGERAVLTDRTGGAGKSRGAKWSLAQKLRGASQRWLGRKPALPASSGLIVPELFSTKVGARLPQLLAAVPGPRTAIFYDAIALKFPEYTPAGTVARFPGYMRELLVFDGIAAISEDSAASLRDYWRWLGIANPPPVHALPLGIEAALAPIAGETTSPALPRVLCVCTIEGRKNHLALLEASETLWAEGLKFELQLVGMARPDTAGAALARVRELQAAGRPLLFPGAVPEAELHAAYRQCSFTVYPSVVEGFGMPVLESLQYGKPCICSGAGALGESAHGGGCVPLASVAAPELASAMRRLLAHPAELSALAAAARARPLKRWPEYAAEFSAWTRTLSRRS